MRLRSILALFALAAAVPGAAQYRKTFPIPTPTVPGSTGVNIHFTKPRAGEMEQLAAAGFRWIRMDFAWGGIERTQGQYDFSAYDGLMAELDRFHIRPIFILDYGNDLYQEGSPRTDESRAAFARFAATAVTHFKNRGVLWEMWNEPNISFWKPTPNVDEYIALALATGKAIRGAAPDEWYIGPGVSGMDFTFLERCFKGGMLEYWDAVSFHPYRNSAPETAAPDFQRVRQLIARYKPANREIPILSSEWGYSEKYPGLDLAKQSRYIVRQALSNVLNGIVVSVWYDWHDDGTDPKEPEHHFGTVYSDYKPKPTYQAISTLTQTLQGSRYNRRLGIGSPTDYCLLFGRGATKILALWTTDPKPHAAHIPANPGRFQAIDMLGIKSDATADAAGLQVTLTDSPQYLVANRANALLDLASHWEMPATAEIATRQDAAVRLQTAIAGDWTEQDRAAVNGLQITIASQPGLRFRAAGRILREPPDTVLQMADFLKTADLPYNSETPVALSVTLQTTSGQTLTQDLVLTSSHPLRIIPQPAVGGRLPVRVENQTEAEFSGRVRLAGAPETAAVPLRFNQGQAEQTVSLPIEIGASGGYRAGVRIETQFESDRAAQRWTPVASAPDVAYRPLETFVSYKLNAAPPTADYRVVPDGDPKVKSTIRVTVAAPPEGLAGPIANALRIDYDFDKGWKFLRLEPETTKRAPLAGRPNALGAWVFGDGSGDVLNARYTDSTGQTFQPTAGRIDWKGWRFVTFSLQGDGGHWGGPDDGAVHYPIHLDSMLLVDSPGGRGGKGTLYATGFTLMTKP